MDDTRYYRRTVIKESVPSSIFKQPRDVKIFLPPGYNDVMSYPVIYCQDGEDFIQFGKMLTHATRLILDEGMEPVIIVCVDIDKSVRTAQYAPEGELFGDYCRFFTEELVPWIEDRYPIRKDPEERILAGDSLGGTVSLHLALDYPQLFRKVIALSGAFLASTIERLEREDRLTWIKLYMVIGLEEQEVKTERGTFDFLEANRRAKALLENKKTDLRYTESPGKHIWGFWQQELPAALMYFLA